MVSYLVSITSQISTIPPANALTIPTDTLAFVDVAPIIEVIQNTIKTSNNREGFVKNLAENAFYATDRKYNVMVFNLSQPYKNGLRGVQFYKSARYDNVQYGIWIFKDGQFINQGDGGYINWAFKGSFKRTGHQGHHVKFRKR
ncbi:MAG: stress protein [Rivularia sp. T60_A2020_040]|nr:stress protein [Rivularia sp. T60_A2020_040]